MLRNYFITALRNIKRQSLFSFLNIAGLSISVTVVILISLFVLHEHSFDLFHHNAENIYRLSRTNQPGINQTAIIYNSLPSALGPSLKSDFAGVKNYVRIDKRNRTSVQHITDADSTTGFIENEVYFADPSIFEVFSFNLISGNPTEALDDPLKMVITKSQAEKYFGSIDVIGKTLLINNEFEFTITGVLEDSPPNSSIDLGFLMSISSYDTMLGSFSTLEGNWNNFAFYTFIHVEDGFDIKNLTDQLPDYVKSKSSLASRNNFDVNIAQPLLDTYLYSEGDQNLLGSMGNPRLLYIFSTVAFLLLLVAALNYVNLSTAKSTLRSTDVGVRKTVGALRSQIIFQYLSEAILISLLCLPLVVLATYYTLPLFNDLLDYQMSLQALPILPMILGFLTLLVLLGIASGFYPALILSKVNPSTVLKTGSMGLGPQPNKMFRTGLLTFQFIVSIGLITSTLLIQKQLSFIQASTFEMDESRILNLNLFRFPQSEIGALKQNLVNLSAIEQASISYNIPFSGTSTIGNQNLEYSQFYVDEDYTETFGLEIIDGRDFSPEFQQSDLNRSVLLNEKAVQHFQLEMPIGSQIALGNSNYTVVGIVKDFHFESLYQEIKPLILINRNVPAYLSLRLNTGNIQMMLSQINEIWSNHTSRPMEYNFLDDQFDNLYKSEDRLSKIFNYFSILTIFIAALGIFGLSGFIAEQRKKEISIRKIFGANYTNLLTVLTREFRFVMTIAFFIALPLSYFGLSSWLQDFAYRVEIHWYIFLLPALFLFLSGLSIIIFQSIRSILINPAENLRNE